MLAFCELIFGLTADDSEKSNSEKEQASTTLLKRALLLALHTSDPGIALSEKQQGSIRPDRTVFYEPAVIPGHRSTFDHRKWCIPTRSLEVRDQPVISTNRPAVWYAPKSTIFVPSNDTTPRVPTVVYTMKNNSK